jgi:hypothetical protein
MSCKVPGALRIGDLHAPRAQQIAVLAGQTHGLAAEAVDPGHEVLLHLPGQDPLDDLHRLGIGDPQSVQEFGLLAHAAQRFVDLRSAAVHHDRLHAHQLEQYHVARKALLQLRVDHRVAAVLDNDRATVKALDVGQRLREDGGRQFCGGFGAVHGK